jgi:hypothetical protein
MNKSFFLVLSIATLLSACNQSEKPAPEVVHETTVIKEVEKPKPESVVKNVEVDNNGVKVNLQDKNGNSFEISKKH